MARIHLVRHGLSEANLDKAVNARKPDHAIELAAQGHEQAFAAGQALAQAIVDAPIAHGRNGDVVPRRVRLLVSPYLRTRQTADGLERAFREIPLTWDRKESLQLREQSFGLFDGVADDELPTVFPREHAHYAKHTEFEGEFFAPMLMGESRAMVADRVRATFGTILRDLDRNRTQPITDLVCVSHGVTIRCFRLGWFNREWEWCEREPNPGNCAITTIEGEQGRGWTERLTFEGFRHQRVPTSGQDRREAGKVE